VVEIRIFILLAVCLFVFSCPRPPVKTCDISNVIVSDEIEFGYLDADGIFHSELPTFIADSIISMENLNNIFSNSKRHPTTIKTILKKIKHDGKEIEFRDIFFEISYGYTMCLLFQDIWFVPDDCDEFYKKSINPQLFLYAETSDAYILTTHILAKNGEFYGEQILFIDDNCSYTIDENDALQIYDNYMISSALQSGWLKLRKWEAKYDKSDKYGYRFYPDTIETIVKWSNLQ